MKNYRVAIIEEDKAQELMDNKCPVYIHARTGVFYTYIDVATDNLAIEDFTIDSIDETVMFGTYPIPRNRRMFPRKVRE